MTVPAALTLRPYEPADEPAVLALLGASLGWVPDAQHEAFFRWKHLENPFGVSPAWVSTDGDRIVGFRIFLRWEFERDGEVVRAVRAVDTATHPDYQGRGIFRSLTMSALEELKADGVAFVFNTPNDNSRPGYLKMGWQPVGVPPVRFRPRNAFTALRLVRARVAAEKWSAPQTSGVAASTLDPGTLPRPDVPARGLATRRTDAYLRWRYGFGPLAYRATVDTDAAVVYRCRRRGSAMEAAVTEVLAGPDSRAGGLLRRTLAESGADYAVRIARRGWLPLPGQGPTLVWRSLNETDLAPLHDWHLTLGDVELF